MVEGSTVMIISIPSKLEWSSTSFQARIQSGECSMVSLVSRCCGGQNGYSHDILPSALLFGIRGLGMISLKHQIQPKHSLLWNLALDVQT